MFVSLMIDNTKTHFMTSETLTLNEQLFAVWEIKQLTIDIRQAANNVEQNKRDILDRPHSDMNEYRELMIQNLLMQIEEKKRLIKEYANEL